MIPVSVAIVTKNEERNIEEALRSVADFREVIVVDDFSADRTIEIAKKYTGRVYQHAWEGYAKQKQRAVDYAAGPWVLVLDADERVTPELKQEIMEVVVPGPSLVTPHPYNGYLVPRKSYFLGRWIRHGGWWPDRTLRLFRKDHGRFEHRHVHERVVVEGKTGRLTHPIEHHTYRTIAEAVRKMDSYASLAADELREHGRRPILPMLLVKPLAAFLKMFLLRLGILDGMHGLLLAALYARYTFLKYEKARRTGS